MEAKLESLLSSSSSRIRGLTSTMLSADLLAVFGVSELGMSPNYRALSILTLNRPAGARREERGLRRIGTYIHSR